MAISIVVAKSTIDLTNSFPVVKELRPHLTLEDFLAIYNQANKADGYTVVIVKDGEKIVAQPANAAGVLHIHPRHARGGLRWPRVDT